MCFSTYHPLTQETDIIGQAPPAAVAISPDFIYNKRKNKNEVAAMFGYITPFIPELRVRDKELYQAYYCGLCRALGKYGLGSKLSLNYDASFAAVLLSAAAGKAPEFEARACAMHPTRGKTPRVKPDDIIDYCAGVCVLLAKYKLLDDAQDGRPLRKAGLPVLASGIRRAEEKYPEAAKALDEGLKKLAEAEAAETCDADAAPLIFGGILGALFASCPYIDERDKPLIGELGKKLGGYVYIADAWDDLEEDRRRGGFNIFLRAKLEEPRETCAAMLDMFINSAVLAYDLMDLKLNKPLLDNVMYLGLAAKAASVLRGEGKRDPDELKKAPECGACSDTPCDKKE